MVISSLKNNDFEFERLRVLLDGIAKNYPAWKRIAIIGGMFGDEILRVANVVQTAGFDTTILTRYCISEKVFVNLDDLFDAINAERKRRLGDRSETDIDPQSPAPGVLLPKSPPIEWWAL